MKIINYNIKLILLILLLYPSVLVAQEEISWIDPNSIDCTVLLEKKDKNQFFPYGTGFILYNYNIPTKPILITCAHLLNKSTIYVTIPAGKELKEYLQKNKITGVVMGASRWAIADSNLRLEVVLKPDSSFVVHESLTAS
jgi:hypothetical protein